jgi:hypothetical protein
MVVYHTGQALNWGILRAWKAAPTALDGSKVKVISRFTQKDKNF